MRDEIDSAAWDRAAKRPYTFSWYQRETALAPRTWRDRLLGRHPTMIVWMRHCVVFHVAEVNVERFGGWAEVLDTFLWPVIHATKDGPLWGTQVEQDGYQRQSIPCPEQPRNPPRCYTQRHADRGDGGGPA